MEDEFWLIRHKLQYRGSQRCTLTVIKALLLHFYSTFTSFCLLEPKSRPEGTITRFISVQPHTDSHTVSFFVHWLVQCAQTKQIKTKYMFCPASLLKAFDSEVITPRLSLSPSLFALLLHPVSPSFLSLSLLSGRITAAGGMCVRLAAARCPSAYKSPSSEAGVTQRETRDGRRFRMKQTTNQMGESGMKSLNFKVVTYACCLEADT